MERAHAAMAMERTPTQAHAYTNMHRHACFSATADNPAAEIHIDLDCLNYGDIQIGG